jgi:hypothetical protein
MSGRRAAPLAASDARGSDEPEVESRLLWVGAARKRVGSIDIDYRDMHWRRCVRRCMAEMASRMACPHEHELGEFVAESRRASVGAIASGWGALPQSPL